jgi:hypothetical protein
VRRDRAGRGRVLAGHQLQIIISECAGGVPKSAGKMDAGAGDSSAPAGEYDAAAGKRELCASSSAKWFSGQGVATR